MRHVLCSGSKWNDISVGFPSHACLSFFSFPHKGVRAGLSCSGWREVCSIVINSMHEFLTACSSSLWSRYVFESGQCGIPLEITVKHSKKLLLMFWGKLLWIGYSIWLVTQWLWWLCFDVSNSSAFNLPSKQHDFESKNASHVNVQLKKCVWLGPGEPLNQPN